MRHFSTFGDYMFDLLFAPLKKGRRRLNQFFIFFRVVGRVFDGIKQDIFRVRSEANVAGASPVMLPIHGQDRDMPHLEGEDIEAYRTRLSMKALIAAKAGTKQGLLAALTALGYEQSHIEPVSMQDRERWAEFIVFLRGARQSSVGNLVVIDKEVRKIKEGSSKPAYGVEAGNVLEIGSELTTITSWYPRCGEIVCGVFPHVISVGRLVRCAIEAQNKSGFGTVKFPKVATVESANYCYQPCSYLNYVPLPSRLTVDFSTPDGVSAYILCSEQTHLKGGQH